MKQKQKVELVPKDFFDETVMINRTAKVVKGGRRFSFNALVVAGNKSGSVGFGFGKANEVPSAIEKATKRAMKKQVRIPLKGTTIPHRILGRFGAAKVMLIPASPGTGIISCAAVRAVLETLGVTDILTKSFGSTNPMNLVRAVMNGLNQLRSRTTIENLRGVRLTELDEKEAAYEKAVAEARARQEKLAAFQQEREDEKLKKQEEAKKRKEARARGGKKQDRGQRFRRPPLRKRSDETAKPVAPADKKPDDKPAETSETKTPDKPEDKTLDKPADTPETKPDTKAPDKPDVKPAETSETKAPDKPEDKTLDKPADTPEKPAKKSSDKPDDDKTKN